MKRILLTLFAFSACLSLVQAQIVITSADFGQPGDTMYYGVDSTFSDSINPVNVGSSGPSQTWDFTSVLTPDLYDTKVILDGSFNPSAPIGTNMIVMSTFDGETDYHMDTIAARLLAADPVLGTPISFRIADFPMQVGKSFNDSSRINIITLAANLGLSIPGIDSVWIKVDILNNVLCDADGSLTTPTGVKNVLRVKEKNTQKIHVSGKGAITFNNWIDITPLVATAFPIPTYSSVFVYTYIANNSKYFIAQANTDSIGTIQNFSYMVPSLPIIPPPVGLNKLTEKNAFLSVYPNPAQDEVMLSFRNNAGSTVHAEIMDVTGKTILRSADTKGNQISVNTSVLQNGIYFCRLSGDGISGTQKIMISK